MKSVYCSIISRHNGFWNMYTSLQAAAAHMMETHNMVLHLAPHIGDSLVSRARNASLANFLESECDYLFTLDDDIALPTDGLSKLLDADKDIVGGLYRLKKPIGDETDIKHLMALRLKPGSDLNIGWNEVKEVTYLSNGCIMHKRSFVEQMVKDYPHLKYVQNRTQKDQWALYMPFIYNNEYLSEDWAFCQRALDTGHKIWVHTNVLCSHMGMAEFKWDDLMINMGVPSDEVK